MLGIILALWVHSAALAQEIVREGNMEKLVIASGEDAGAWGCAEATMTSTTERTKTGTAVLHFHIDVDHHAGEKAYPIGWPRTNRPFSEDWQRDWSAFDFVRLWVHADTSREKLPSSPVGLILYTPDKARAYHRALSEVRKGEWVKIEVPISRIPRHENVTRVQFFVSESNYKDHDVVDFYIDDICLLRYAEPHLSEVALRPSVAFADAASFVVTFRASGIPKDKKVQATASLVAEGQDLLHVRQEVVRGANELALNLRGSKVPAGYYKVRVALEGGDAQELDLRVVDSPWTEE